MLAHRYRWGAVAWLLTLQFFVAETIAQARSAIPYSRSDEVISALGTSVSPGHVLMNASFVAQGLLIAAGLVLLGPALIGPGRRVAELLLGLSAAGVVVAGLAPQDTAHGLHVAGALLYLLGGSLGLLGLAYALRPRSEAVGTAVVLLGVLATAMAVFFLTGVTQLLGTGGTERAAAYPVPIALALAGAALWRLAGPGPAADTHARGADRRRLREEERAEKERLAGERNAALEAAAARHAATTEKAAGEKAAADARPASAAEEPGDVDLDEHWRTPRRRGE